MNEAQAVVIVVDDDPSFRCSTERLIRSSGFEVQTFATAAAFLKSKRLDVPACLVLDVRMPGLSGLDLQTELIRAGIEIPIIFVTGHGDIPMSVKAIKAGAVEFLTKPFREQELFDALEMALKRDRLARAARAKRAVLQLRYDRLT